MYCWRVDDVQVGWRICFYVVFTCICVLLQYLVGQRRQRHEQVQQCHQCHHCGFQRCTVLRYFDVFWIISNYIQSLSFFCYSLVDIGLQRYPQNMWYLQKIRLQMCPRLAPSCWIEYVNDGFVVGATKRSAIGYRDLHIVDGTCQCEASSRRAVSES